MELGRVLSKYDCYLQIHRQTFVSYYTQILCTYQDLTPTEKGESVVYLYVNSRKGRKKAGLTGHKRLDLKVSRFDCHSSFSHNIDWKKNEKLLKKKKKKKKIKNIQKWAFMPPILSFHPSGAMHLVM